MIAALETDLLWGLGLMTWLTTWLFVKTLQWSQHCEVRTRNLAALLTAATLVVYVQCGYQSNWMLMLIPLSNVIVLGNWLPLFCSAIAGISAGDLTRPRWLRASLAATVLGIGGYSLLHPLMGESPVHRTTTRGWVHMQSTDVSCAPAAAATLLAWHDLPATEKELADLSLTRPHGTLWSGTYRGLKQKTANTPLKVEVLNGTVDDLRRMRGPFLLHVGLKDSKTAPARYTDREGWIPGRAHAVVLVRFDGPDRVLVVEPCVGKQWWSVEDLQWLWHGQAMRLVPRQTADDSAKVATR